MNLDKYIKKAARLDDAKNDVLRLAVDGETFEFKRLNDADYDKIQTRVMDMTQDKGNDTILKICEDLIYFSNQDLHDQELLDTLDVVRPPDVVAKIFSPAEVSAIGASLLEFNGLTDVDTVKKL